MPQYLQAGNFFISSCAKATAVITTQIITIISIENFFIGFPFLKIELSERLLPEADATFISRKTIFVSQAEGGGFMGGFL
jgi:hypothetical protein